MFKKMTDKFDWLRRQVGHGKEIQAVCSLNAEFTRPLWVFGMSSYDFIQSNEQGSIIACSYRCFTIVSKYIYTHFISRELENFVWKLFRPYECAGKRENHILAS